MDLAEILFGKKEALYLLEDWFRIKNLPQYTVEPTRVIDTERKIYKVVDNIHLLTIRIPEKVFYKYISEFDRDALAL